MNIKSIPKYNYLVFADVQNDGRKCIFISKDWHKAEKLMRKIENGEFERCYMNAKMEKEMI